jgi:hypothetical protein
VNLRLAFFQPRGARSLQVTHTTNTASIFAFCHSCRYAALSPSASGSWPATAANHSFSCSTFSAGSSTASPRASTFAVLPELPRDSNPAVQMLGQPLAQQGEGSERWSASSR